MTSTSLTYQLNPSNGLVRHGTSVSHFFRDADTQEEVAKNMELDAEVRSGDFFVSLATKLDVLDQNVEDWYVRMQLEDIVSQLIYLQDNYTIAKKRD